MLHKLKEELGGTLEYRRSQGVVCVYGQAGGPRKAAACVRTALLLRDGTGEPKVLACTGDSLMTDHDDNCHSHRFLSDVMMTVDLDPSVTLPLTFNRSPILHLKIDVPLASKTVNVSALIGDGAGVDLSRVR